MSVVKLLLDEGMLFEEVVRVRQTSSGFGGDSEGRTTCNCADAGDGSVFCVGGRFDDDGDGELVAKRVVVGSWLDVGLLTK